jgi:hypothetical protein
VIGGFVYRGSAIPGLAGAYLFADECAGTVDALVLGNGTVVDEREIGAGGPIASFGQDLNGELYVLSLSGAVYRIDPAGPGGSPEPRPAGPR